MNLENVSCVCVTSDNKYIISGHAKGKIKIWKK